MDGKQIKALREVLSLSQPEFARVYAIPLGTLRRWEQGTRQPSQGSAMLRAIERDPETMRKLLAKP